jgi:hypothetical protein
MGKSCGESAVHAGALMEGLGGPTSHGPFARSALIAPRSWPELKRAPNNEEILLSVTQSLLYTINARLSTGSPVSAKALSD